MIRLAVVQLAAAQCGPNKDKPYPPGKTECPPKGSKPPGSKPGGGPGGKPGGGPGGGRGGGPGGPMGDTAGARAPSSTSTHAAPMLGDVGRTTASGTNVRTGNTFTAGENIYGPFEAGFGTQQDGILAGLGCSPGSLGHVAGGLDTYTAEQMVAYQCEVILPRVVDDQYISLLDECGGHTREYHFHEKLSCLYDANSGGHSAKVGEASDKKPIYGKWEHDMKKELPLLDACGRHWGRTPESPDKDVYHYHVQDEAPFTVGCFGPNDDGSLVTVQQCRDFYSGCDGNLVTVTTPQGSKQYDDWCPCFDANGSNSGVDIVELAVFSSIPSSSPTSPSPAPSHPSSSTPPSPSSTDDSTQATATESVASNACFSFPAPLAVLMMLGTAMWEQGFASHKQ